MTSAPSTVVGVDGARGGWLIAALHNRQLSLRFDPSLEGLVAHLDTDVSVVAIDMPIGLSADGVRPADAEARARLGPRRATFFPTPVHGVLGCDTYADANALSRTTSGSGLSKQAWNLVPKIREVDGLWRPDLADRLVEAHPEVCFATMAGAPVMTKKQTTAGHDERLGLVASALQPELDGAADDIISAALDDLRKPQRVDAVDALALLWTAQRVHDGSAITLGGERNAQGRPMALHI